MKYSISIVGHPKRQELADDLVRRIQADAPGCRMKLFMDEESRGLKWNLWRAIQDTTYDDDEYRFIIQEDVLPCRDFYQSLGVATETLIRLKGCAVPQFYANNVLLQKAVDRGKHWIKGTLGIWGQIHAAPLGNLRHFCEWADTGILDTFDRGLILKPGNPGWPDDWALGWYYKYHNIPVYYSSPTLVQHRGHRISTLGHKPGGVKGQTRWFIGEDVSGLSVDWSKI